MGLTISKMLSRLFSKKEMRILMVRAAPAPGAPPGGGWPPSPRAEPGRPNAPPPPRRTAGRTGRRRQDHHPV